MPAGWDFSVGNKLPQSTAEAAEQAGKGMYVDIPLLEDDYLILSSTIDKVFLSRIGARLLLATV